MGRSVYTGFQCNPKGNMRGIQKEILVFAVYATEDPSLLSDKNNFTGLFCPFASTLSSIFPSPLKQSALISDYKRHKKFREFIRNFNSYEYDSSCSFHYPLSYRVPVRERYGSALLPATREQHDQNCTQSH